MIKAILFDFDDTLIKTLETKIHPLKHVGKKYYGLDLNDEDIKKHWGKPFKEMMTLIYKKVDDVEKIIERYTLERESFPSPAYEDVVDALKKLSKKYILGIITSHTKKYIKKDLKDAGISENLFFIIQTEEDTSIHKPDPRVFDHVLTELAKKGIHKSSVAYIGDGLHDYFAARDAGIKFYGIAGRTTTKDQFAKENAQTINSLHELINI